jgi:hypothetical protein
MGEFVESVRYEADIRDITDKLDRLSREQGDLEADTKKQTSKMEGHWDKLKKGIGGLSGTMKTVGSGLGVVAGAAAVFGPQVLSAGVEIESLEKKAQTVFSDGSLAKVKGWADGVAASLGLTESKAIGVAAGIGDLLKPMGFTADQAAGMSTKLVDLSGALSAWTGGTQSASEVSDVLTKALLGETDGLKSLGISISAADVEARLAAKGQKDLTGEALAQAKALATQELIMEKSTDAQKAWADGSMDAVKAQNEAKAAGAQLSENINRLLYPALKTILPPLTKAVEWLAEHLPPAIEKAKQWFEQHLLPIIKKVGDFFGNLVGWVREHWDEISSKIETTINFIRDVIEKVTAVIQGIWDRFGDEIVAAIKFAWDTISVIVKTAIELVRGIIETVTSLIKGDWSAVWDGIKRIFEAVWEAMKAFVQLQIDAVKLIISTAWEAVKLIFETVWNAIKGFFEGIWNGMKEAVNTAVEGMKTLVKNGWEFIKGLFTGAVDFITGLPSKFLDAAKLVGTAIWDGIKEGVGSIADKLWMFLQAVVDKVPEWAGKLLTAAKDLGSSMWNGITEGFGNLVDNIWDWITDFLAEVPKMGRALWNGATDLGKSIIEGIVNGVGFLVDKALDVGKAVVNSIIGFINDKVIGPINTAIRGALGWLPGSPPQIPKIPTLHTGGVVPGFAGQEVLTILKARETVRTEAQERALGGAAGHDGAFTLYVAPGAVVVQGGAGVDGAMIGREIVDELARYTRQNGRGWISGLGV